MKIDFNVYEYDYNDRDGNLDVEAQGVVKSEKHFPYFYKNGKKIIYKPLSKTKPLSTPYFAYSEVIWSTLINTFFDNTIPIYHLATIKNYEDILPKYHSYGTIVESITKNDEKMCNLYEYYQMNPEECVDIKNYINYCLITYDYTLFFKSKLFQNNPTISQEIAKQILYSILRADQNYHYENVAFIYQNNKIKSVAPPIDHEFSTMFIYLDQPDLHKNLFNKYINQFNEDPTENMSEQAKLLYTMLSQNNVFDFKSNILKNIEIITKLHPNLIEDFNNSLNKMISYLEQNPIIIENHNYIKPFNSNEYEAGILKYKENKLIEAQEKMNNLKKYYITPDMINEQINQEIIIISKKLQKILNQKQNQL